MQFKNMQKIYGYFKAKRFRYYKTAVSFLIICSFLLIGVFSPDNGDAKLFAAGKIVVFLDPGHGGIDPGATWYGFQEKTANLDIALRVKSKLETNGFKVVMLRTTDINRSLDERVAIANSSRADIFVSIHNNASLSPYAHGTETYWCANGVPGSSQLASLIQSNIVSSAGRANRGVKTANFRVIKYTSMPAALVECAFMSNQTESDLLKTESFREKLASGIYKGIAKFSEGINKASNDEDKQDDGNDSTTSATAPSTGGNINNKNTYSDLSHANASGFTIKIELPENDAKIFSQFELRGWAADLRGTPAKKLVKLEVYKIPERNRDNLIGKIDDFNNNVLGSQGVLNGGFSLKLDIDKLSEGENILYVYAFDEKGDFSIGNIKLNIVKNGNISKINRNPVAVPGGPYNGAVNTDIKFDGSGSYDPDGILSEYTWDFGDGSEPYTGNNSGAAKPAHKYTKKGTYTVNLTVKDKFGKVSATVSTTASATDPGAAETQTSDTGSSTTQQSGTSALFEDVSNATNFTGYIDISSKALIKIFAVRDSGKIKRAARLAPLYIKYGKLFNLRADLAWAQMCHETNFLEFTGDVKARQNNFAGIGATGGGVPGNSFATEELGVIAHFAHLAWYYFPKHINEYCNKTHDPRHFGKGHINYKGKTTLGFLNGRWAPGKNYTDKIILFANQIIQGINSDGSGAVSGVVAYAGPDMSGVVGQNLTFDASGSHIQVSSGDKISYSWDWNGDGNFEQTVENAVVSHIFESAGTFNVTLKITTAVSGLKSKDKLYVSINSIPVADAGGPYTCEAEQDVTFNGSNSKDPDGKIIKYLWDFGDGDTASGMSPVHAYSEPGKYLLKLTVVDDKNTSSTTVQTEVTVKEKTSSDSDSGSQSSDTSETTETNATETGTEETAANQVPLADPGGPYSAKVNTSITFDGSKSSDPDGNIKKYIWDFGDGNTATGQKPSHTYKKAGSYTVKLTVKDNSDLKSAAAATTAVIEAEPESQYQPNTSIITNSTSFIGYTEVSVDQLVGIFIKKGSSKVEKAMRIAPLYIKYAKIFNLRADIAWAQMCHETGFLEYTGDVKPEQNNFAGIGATGGGVPGNSFASEELGIIAHLAHLAWYYYPNHVNQYCGTTYDPRHFGGTHYKYTGDTSVGFLNGRWAPGATYTSKILLFANQIYGN